MLLWSQQLQLIILLNLDSSTTVGLILHRIFISILLNVTSESCQLLNNHYTRRKNNKHIIYVNTYHTTQALYLQMSDILFFKTKKWNLSLWSQWLEMQFARGSLLYFMQSLPLFQPKLYIKQFNEHKQLSSQQQNGNGYFYSCVKHASITFPILCTLTTHTKVHTVWHRIKWILTEIQTFQTLNKCILECILDLGHVM